MSSSSLESNVREDFALGTGSGFTGFIDSQNAGLGWDNVTRGSGAVTATSCAGPVHRQIITATSTATNHIHPNVRARVEIVPLVFSPLGEFLRLDEEDKPFVINNKRTKGGTLHRLPRARKKLVDLPLNATTVPILPRLESFCRIHRRLILFLHSVRDHEIEILPTYPANHDA